MKKISDLFEVTYGVNLELNALKKDRNGVNFVSRTAKNNGVSAKVKLIDGINPIPAGTISVAGGGSVMESFLQPEPYYSGRDLYFLTPKIPMSDQVKLYYCVCIRANKYRYNYGRQANRTLKDILVPDISEIPAWTHSAELDRYQGADAPVTSVELALDVSSWGTFKYKELFIIERGRGPRKKDLNGKGKFPFVSASEYNNGITDYSDLAPYHKAGVITVARNGASVASAFYQEVPFHSTEDVHVFTPRFEMSKSVALFFCSLIKREKYRYSYGRKWGIGRMNETYIKLPITLNGKPDFVFMERYINSLPYSSQINVKLTSGP
jgi:restriction endonuclease S subunit